MDLHEKWMNLCERIGIKETEAQPTYKLLAGLYSQQRHYHTLTHIEHCLLELEDAKNIARHPDEVELAIWFHDVVYSTKAKDNEKKSAELFMGFAGGAGVDSVIVKRVSDLILATKHDKLPETIDAKVLTDIDLAILGGPANEFSEYEINIRKEYAWVPEEQFKLARAHILRGFLDRQHIYSTDFFREKYDLQARENLERSLASLANTKS